MIINGQADVLQSERERFGEKQICGRMDADNFTFLEKNSIIIKNTPRFVKREYLWKIIYIWR